VIRSRIERRENDGLVRERFSTSVCLAVVSLIVGMTMEADLTTASKAEEEEPVLEKLI
jgi:hypothetical protein